MVLNETIAQWNSVSTYRTLYPKTEEYMFFSSAHKMLFKIDYMLGHRTSLNKFKRIETISRTLTDQNGMKLETK